MPSSLGREMQPKAIRESDIYAKFQCPLRWAGRCNKANFGIGLAIEQFQCPLRWAGRCNLYASPITTTCCETTLPPKIRKPKNCAKRGEVCELRRRQGSRNRVERDGPHAGSLQIPRVVVPFHHGMAHGRGAVHRRRHDTVCGSGWQGGSGKKRTNRDGGLGAKAQGHGEVPGLSEIADQFAVAAVAQMAE